MTHDVMRTRLWLVIRSFKDADTEALFHDEVVPRFRAIERPARRKLLYLNRARVLQDLKVPPGESPRGP